MKGEIDNSKKIGDLNTLFSIIGRTIKQKINKVREDVNNTTNQIDLTDIYRKLPTKLTELTFIENPTKQQQNRHSFQAHVGHSLRSLR